MKCLYLSLIITFSQTIFAQSKKELIAENKELKSEIKKLENESKDNLQKTLNLQKEVIKAKEESLSLKDSIFRYQKLYFELQTKLNQIKEEKKKAQKDKNEAIDLLSKNSGKNKNTSSFPSMKSMNQKQKLVDEFRLNKCDLKENQEDPFNNEIIKQTNWKYLYGMGVKKIDKSVLL